MDALLLFLKPFHEIGTKLIVLFFAAKLFAQWWNESGKTYFDAEKNAAFVNENLLKKDIATAQETLAHNSLTNQEKRTQLLTIQKNIALWQEKNLSNHQKISEINAKKATEHTQILEKKRALRAQSKQILHEALETLAIASAIVVDQYQTTADCSKKLSRIIEQITQERMT
jgi:hypothetical protein